MNPMVEFCISNLVKGAQDTYDILENDPTIDLLESGCLSHCTRCEHLFFAIVEGEVVEADTPEELTKKIYESIENNPIWGL